MPSSNDAESKEIYGATAEQRTMLRDLLNWHQERFGWGDMPLDVAARNLGEALDLDLIERDGHRTGVYFAGERDEIEVEIVSNYGALQPQGSAMHVPQEEPDFPEHRTIVKVGVDNDHWWQAHRHRATGLQGLTFLRVFT